MRRKREKIPLTRHTKKKGRLYNRFIRTDYDHTVIITMISHYFSYFYFTDFVS